MSRKTRFSVLYKEILTLITASTGRRSYQSKGIQGSPKGTYAVLYFESAIGIENSTVERIELSGDDIPDSGELLKQIPWNTSLVDVKVEFFRSGANDSALDAATRFQSYLQLQNRFYDIWTICGLAGSIDIIDVGAIAGADIEPRTRVLFSINANIADPEPLTPSKLTDIETQVVNITHVEQGGTETIIENSFENPEN